jgi:Kef-type K+ transport system membrane component KefB
MSIMLFRLASIKLARWLLKGIFTNVSTHNSEGTEVIFVFMRLKASGYILCWYGETSILSAFTHKDYIAFSIYRRPVGY